MERRLRALAEDLTRRPDPGRARDLARLLERARVDCLDLAVTAANACPVAPLVGAVWGLADRAQRLPPLTGVAFLGSPADRLPQVQVVRGAAVRFRGTREVARYHRSPRGWSRVDASWRRWRQDPENSFETVDLLDFLAEIHRARVRGSRWEILDLGMANQLWGLEDRDRYVFYRGDWRDHHPWLRDLPRGTRQVADASRFSVFRQFELPDRLNAPMFRNLSRAWRDRFVGWAAALY